MLGLRLAEGLEVADYPDGTWHAVERRYGRALEQAVRSGRLERTTTGGLRIPSRFRFVADDILARIEADADAECLAVA